MKFPIQSYNTIRKLKSALKRLLEKSNEFENDLRNISNLLYTIDEKIKQLDKILGKNIINIKKALSEIPIEEEYKEVHYKIYEIEEKLKKAKKYIQKTGENIPDKREISDIFMDLIYGYVITKALKINDQCGKKFDWFFKTEEYEQFMKKFEHKIAKLKNNKEG